MYKKGISKNITKDKLNDILPFSVGEVMQKRSLKQKNVCYLFKNADIINV